MQITTETGFSCDVDADLLDDWDFMDAAFTVEETEDRTEALKMGRYLVNKMLPKEDADRLKEHCRSLDGGRLRATRMESEITDIFTKLGIDSKN